MLVIWASGSRVALPNPGNDVLARVPLAIGDRNWARTEGKPTVVLKSPRYISRRPDRGISGSGSKSKKVIKEALLPEAEQSSE